MTFSRTATALLAGLVALATPALAQEFTVTHAQGETTLPGVPQKVVSFDFAAIETLEAIGVDVAGLPGSNLPAHLEKYASDDYAKVGSLFEPDYEALAALEPDLIIVAGRSSTAYPELANLAPTVDLSNEWTNFYGSIKANAEIIGEIFDKEAEVAALIAETEAKVEASRAAAADAGKGLVVLTSGAEVTAYGPGSRFGYIHETLGVTPVIEDVEAATHGDSISFEFILETNPDLLFVIDRDAATGQGAAAAILDNELVGETTAWRNGDVVYIDPVRAYIVNGGLISFGIMADQVTEALSD
ncbi:iron complex transport system substrate-binding protein [Devosia subaequoris]|uniref:Iron complex transport system substrate-binding protein n=1 Tax=Devosia subaequoris TaxID=395930 RepID=A0A7W6NCL7_9HYPH|nr:siderophore ABC transporter substrate-binding protein [Devosia subaequoris]MBB4052904.1 iron complex transport system substrate-binding protein [Devosia subaequoris]MCP1210323.1 siderophore ABC transporter substrate-binding protein [Devosia subaequoris]